MISIFNALRRVFTMLVITLGTALVVAGAYSYYRWSEITKHYVDRLNVQSGGSIQVGAMQLAVLESFPGVALVLHNVSARNTTKSGTHWITARKVHCIFDVWKLLRGRFALSSLILEQGKLHLSEIPNKWLERRVSMQGATNCTSPWKSRSYSIHLKHVEVLYKTEQQHCVMDVTSAQANVKWRSAGLESDWRCEATVQRIQLAEVALSPNLPVSAEATLYYDQSSNTWALLHAQLNHKGALLKLQGSWRLEPASHLSLVIRGENINPQMLLQGLPRQYRPEIVPLKLLGSLGLNMKIEKLQHAPCGLLGDLTWHDGAIVVKGCAEPVRLDALQGCLDIPNMQDLTTAKLSIDHVTGMLARSRLTGHLVLQDFLRFHLRCTTQATLDLASLGTSFTDPTISDASGQLNLQWSFETNLLSLMQGASLKDNLVLSGVLQARAVRYRIGQSQLLCKDITGCIHFQDDTITTQDLSGSLGPGSFALCGTVRHFLSNLLTHSPKVYADARFYIDHLDLDTLFFDTNLQPPRYQNTHQSLGAFMLPAHWVLNLDCDIQQLHFHRFRGRNVRGSVKVKERKLALEKLQIGFAGGKIFLDTSLDAVDDRFDVRAAARLQDIQIAQLFYVSENFHQNFLTDKHLSGKVHADVDLAIEADKCWKLNWDSLTADIYVRLLHGALREFGLIQNIAKYVPKESLSSLRFSERKNHVVIKDRTIRFSPMEVYANKTRIWLSGEHTFDGKIAYNISVSFAGMQQSSKREDMLEQPTTREPADIGLSFQVKGSTSRYKVSYDAKASRKSLQSALKEQGKIISDLVRGKYQDEKRHQELTQDDYFALDE